MVFNVFYSTRNGIAVYVYIKGAHKNANLQTHVFKILGFMRVFNNNDGAVSGGYNGIGMQVMYTFGMPKKLNNYKGKKGTAGMGYAYGQCRI